MHGTVCAGLWDLDSEYQQYRYVTAVKEEGGLDEEDWWGTEQMWTVPGADGCDMLVDGGVDSTHLIHEGKEFEEEYAKDGSLPDTASTDNDEF